MIRRSRSAAFAGKGGKVCRTPRVKAMGEEEDQEETQEEDEKLDEEEEQQVCEWLRSPPPPESVDPQLVPRAHRMTFLRAVESTITVDGEVSPEERESLLVFARLIR